MYKNQLQELAQRSCFNLPSYSCIREGPDHAPRFKATVSFNGEVFESPGYYTTLRQAEHAAAKLALSTLSKRGPTQFLAARILDETGVCKNLLQETAQRAGVSLPVYTTIRSGPRHLPLFTCLVEVGGRSFVGEPAKTKKQAEKNAALAAWSSIKHSSPFPLLHDSFQGTNINPPHEREDQASLRSSLVSGTVSQRSKVRSLNVRDRNRMVRDESIAAGSRYYYPTQASSSAATDALVHEQYPFVHGSNISSSSITASGEVSHDAGQKLVYKQPHFAGTWSQPSARGETLAQRHFSRAHNLQATPGSLSSRQQVGSHHRRHSLSGMESPALMSEAVLRSRASGGGSMLAQASPYPQQIRGLPYQSLSERFELNRPSLLEDLQLKDEEDTWCQQNVVSSSAQPHRYPARRIPWQSQSERFDHRNHFLPQVEEADGWDEEEWPSWDSHGPADIEPRHEKTSSCKEGWLRGDTLLRMLEAQKNHGYREGWLREEIQRQNLNENRHLYRESWPDGEAPKFSINGASCSSHVNNNAQSNILCGERERRLAHGNAFNETQAETNSTLSGSAISTTPSSPLSLLWAKSTQWWGSHRPSSPSSAAAALASTLGLRPALSTAPAVRVRQMVPVCSAPPVQRADVPPFTHRAPADHCHSSTLADSEANVNQLFNSLRL